MTIDDLLPFLYNIQKEAVKGYYVEDNPDWIRGYLAAIEDVVKRIEDEREI